MEFLLSLVEKGNAFVSSIVWGPPMLVFMLAVGIFLTCGTGFFQIRRFGHVFQNTIIAAFRDKKVKKTDDAKAISQFQALATALAATVGTGNIVGVATAIATGGAGAVFWMWVSAFFGMMTGFAEKVLGIYFRHKNENGEWVGGPMHYIEKGLGQKWLAVLFSVFCLFASFGIGSIAQVNGIATAMNTTFRIPSYVTGIVVCILIAVIIFGGLKRIASVTEKLVPVMAIFYFVGAVVVIGVNIKHVPAAFAEIFEGAFSLKSIGGGVMGYAITRAMRYGLARGVFSNEAGLGSSVIVHSCADVKEPVVQGLWGIFEVFFDTIVICTLTALAVITTGAHRVEGLEGVNITMYAFKSVFGEFGGYIITIGLSLFAFSTILGWTVYGTRAAEYLGNKTFLSVYRMIFLGVVFLGSVSQVRLVWELSDTFNGLMAIPNLIAVAALSGTVLKITKNYTRRIFKGENIPPKLSYMQEKIQKK